MPDETITSPDGEILRLIAKVKTTPHSDNSVKEIKTDSVTIEVLIFDALLTSFGSQWGHVAIDIDGVIYSRAHSSYVEMSVKRAQEYRKSNQEIRAFVGLMIRVSPQEKKIIEVELKRRVSLNKPYSISNNSCSSNVADVLEMIGILAHDPRFQLNPNSTNLVSPKELLIILSRSKRVVQRINYPMTPKK